MADRTATWTDADFSAPDAERVARDEDTVRREFWRKLKRFAARLPFAEDLLAAYYCAFDRETPFAVKAALLGALGPVTTILLAWAGMDEAMTGLQVLGAMLLLGGVGLLTLPRR